MKIDVSHMFAVLDQGGANVLQAALGIVGAGRTAMVFVSGPARRHPIWLTTSRSRVATPSTSQDRQVRIACIERLCAHLRTFTPETVLLAQALLEPEQREVADALRGAGFQQLGELAYMRRTSLPDPEGSGDWAAPPGLRLQRVSDLLRTAAPENADRDLCTALDRTYIDTKDCPELCGLRSVEDVLRSHRAVGVHHPEIWWMLSDSEGPQGCMLFNVCPEQDSVELVYIGLSPKLRGRSLGRSLLEYGLSEVARFVLRDAGADPAVRITGTGGMTCAVDTRNPAAVRLYRSLGFQRFALRVPLVRSLRG